MASPAATWCWAGTWIRLLGPVCNYCQHQSCSHSLSQVQTQTCMKCPGIPGTVIIFPGVIWCGAAMFVVGREGFAMISLPTPFTGFTSRH